VTFDVAVIFWKTNNHFLCGMEPKVRRVLAVIAAFFITNSLLAEFIGVKIFSLERSLGFQPVNWTIFGIEQLSFNLTAGALLWPFVFILTDITNEYFGKRGVKLLSLLAVAMIGYAFLMVFLAITVIPADFWSQGPVPGSQPARMIHLNDAFRTVFGQGLWIIIGSLTAFLVGQVVDVLVFHAIRKRFGEKMLWLRATGSTLVSQLIDSFVVLYIAFYLGADWSLQQVTAIALVNYCYKTFMAIALTPLIYLAHRWIDSYLGMKLAKRMMETAARQ
jgi:hypothetical protein